MDQLFSHTDPLKPLDAATSLADKLRALHRMLRLQHPFVDRIAVALHDAQTDCLHTYLSSSDKPSPLTQYQAKLNDSPSLMAIVQKGQPRVVNDLSIYAHNPSPHAKVMAESGFAASYTVPVFHADLFLGFVFFNSQQKDVFEESILGQLDMVAHFIAVLIAGERDVLKTLRATVQSAMSFTHYRDPETAGHIDRMSRYARIIARELAPRYGFDDQFVEHIFLFSPLHDLGKIGIPDQVLLKPGKLSDEEFAVMKTHTEKGREIIDTLLRHYGLDGVSYVTMLRNIALHHHEAVDGSGYPMGLKANAIPIEARIVAVADVFDALTSRRPYKDAWDNDRAFATLQQLAGKTLDAECVQALMSRREEVETVKQRFREDSIG